MDLAIFVVPIEGDAHLLFSILVDFNVVSFFQSCDEMSCVFFAEEFDPEIINY